MKKLLQVKNLNIAFSHFGKSYDTVKNVSFDLRPGESIAIVGESGSGKSVTAKAILGLNPRSCSSAYSGHIYYKETDLLTLSEKSLQKIRGREIGIIFQDPMTSLNPTMKIGAQILENLKQLGSPLRSSSLYERVLELLDLVGIDDPKTCYKSYPHELSGGMRQRVMIAITLALKPKILIADEPTTALDVTIQRQILELLSDLQKKLLMSIIFITHDLSLISTFCSKVLVMYAGTIVESAPTKTLFKNPRHPYTKQLLRSIPRITQDKAGKLMPVKGSPPSIFDEINGCGFFPRCPEALHICEKQRPCLRAPETASEAKVACWLYDSRYKPAKIAGSVKPQQKDDYLLYD